MSDQDDGAILSGSYTLDDIIFRRTILGKTTTRAPKCGNHRIMQGVNSGNVVSNCNRTRDAIQGVIALSDHNIHSISDFTGFLNPMAFD